MMGGSDTRRPYWLIDISKIVAYVSDMREAFYSRANLLYPKAIAV